MSNKRPANRRMKRTGNKESSGKGLNKTVKKAGLLGVGIYADLEEKIHSLIDKLVEDEGITKEEGKKYLGEIKKSSKEQTELVSKKLTESKDATVVRFKELEEKVKDLEKKLEKKDKKVINVEDDIGVSGKSAAQMKNAENVRRAYAEAEAKKKAESELKDECDCGEEDCEYCNSSSNDVKETETKDTQASKNLIKGTKDAAVKQLKQLEEKVKGLELKLGKKGEVKTDEKPTISGKSEAQMRNAENVRKAYTEAEAKKKEKAKKAKKEKSEKKKE